MNDNSYTFTGELWRYPGPDAWFFITLPLDLADEINARHANAKRGFGSLPVRVAIGDSVWETSLFASKNFAGDHGRTTFLLPVKALIRKQERIDDGSRVDVTFSVRLSL